MDTKKAGIALIVLSLLFGAVTLSFMQTSAQQSKELSCASAPGCSKVVSVLNLSHLAVGIIFSALSLGVYLLLFNRKEQAFYDRTEQAICHALKKVEKEQKIKISGEKFSALMKALSESEQKVLEAVRKEEGIEQNTLRLRTGLSKAKISQVLTDFQKKGIVKREEKGKTYSVYLGSI